nr:Lpg1974 family pore-forming outer membrane protein [Legionella nagasakiensis]
MRCERNAWGIGIQALYLKSSYGNTLGFLGIRENITGTPPFVSQINQVAVQNVPMWSWGFKLEVSYHFHTGNDLNLNWYHLNGKTTSSNADFIFTFIERSLDADRASYKPRWDAVNLELGQHVDFGEFKNICFYGGAQYARIKYNITCTTQVTPDDFIRESYEFTGFGPRVGADMSYDLARGFAIYANSAIAALAGTGKFHRFLGAVNASRSFQAETSKVVPEQVTFG